MAPTLPPDASVGAPRRMAAWRSDRSGRRLAALVVLAAAQAQGRELLRVRADAEFVNLGLSRGPSTVEVSGGLRDDAGHAVVDAVVSLPISGDATQAAPCRSGERLQASGGTVAVHTDGLGFFCVRLRATEPVEGRELHYDGDRFHSAAATKIPRETGKRRLVLAFETRELVASLDSPSFVVWVTTRDAAGVGTGDPVRLVLVHRPAEDGATETEVGATDVQLGSTARFDVETRLLGSPGAGRLVVRFEGTSSLSPVAETALLERRATAHLSLAAPPSPAEPSDGIPISVGVSSAVGAVNEGYVEAVAAGSPAGLARVAGGAARVVTTFDAPRGRPAQVALRYVPATNGYVAEPPLLIEIPAPARSPWAGTPWLFGVAAIAYWVVRSWLRPSRRAAVAPPSRDAPPGHAAVELLSTDLSRSGWRGRVVDAHDAAPIAGARVSIVVPVFDGEGVAAAQTSGEDGSFALPHVEAAKNDGARLVVTAPHHTTLSERAPSDGTLSICLVSRRRTLLDRLVAWAKKSGSPWGRGKEPTPLELVAAARRKEQREVEGWAAAVAEAAYGPLSPDERHEQDIVAREPPLSGPRDDR